MPAIPGNRVFRRLFTAQIVALVGTGLMTVALALLAFDLAGARAGQVLGTALAIKMVAYVFLAPLAEALTRNLPRRRVMIAADLLRATTALALPFVDAVWQVYVLIFVLQAASASFTPAFQATIPDVLPDEADYTRALSLSRLAYDLESLLSPAVAALLLLVLPFSALFAGTTLGFVGSAALILVTPLPPRRPERDARSFVSRLTRGVTIYLATPRLRGLLALNAAAAAVGAFVIVNTVTLVRVGYGGSAAGVAAAMAAFGAGSMVAALGLPRLLGRVGDRAVMMGAALGLSALGLGGALVMIVAGLPGWSGFLGLWAGLGLMFSAILTPAGRLLRRSAHAEDRPAIFAAQFALSHACWLVSYPLAGLVGTLSMALALATLSGLALVATAVAHTIWPHGSSEPLAHDHPGLPPDHPHLARHAADGQHAHAIVIDDEHHVWPSQG